MSIFFLLTNPQIVINFVESCEVICKLVKSCDCELVREDSSLLLLIYCSQVGVINSLPTCRKECLLFTSLTKSYSIMRLAIWHVTAGDVFKMYEACKTSFSIQLFVS